MALIVIYARKSTESEDRQVLSIDSQAKELKNHAKREGFTIDKVFTESKSAKSPGRPVFNEIISMVQKGKIDSIVCWKLDRLARNPVDGGGVIWELEKGQLNRIITPQRDFVNTGNDKFWMQLEFGMAKKYVDDLSDNTKRGLRAKLELGWMPGLPPLGYLNDKVNKTVVRDPRRFRLIRKMWDMMLTGSYSPKKILDIATNKWGLRTRKLNKIGGGPIAYSTVYDIFNNPFYCSVIKYKGEYYKGAHEPVVSKEEFDKVRSLLNPNNNRPKSYFFPYTGLITCGECGASVTAEHKVNRYGYHYVYYHCTRRKRMVKCTQKVVEEKELENQISAFLDKITIDREFAEWAFDVIDELEADCRENDAKVLDSLNRRIKAIDAEISELLNLKLRGLLNDKEYLNKKNELLGEQINLERRVKQFGRTGKETSKKCKDTFELAAAASEEFKNGTPERKRAILTCIGSNLVLRDKKLLIKPQKPLEIIKNNLPALQDKSARFEPQKSGLYKHKNQLKSAGFCAGLRVVEEVRTFFISCDTHL